MVEWLVVCEAHGDFVLATGLADHLAKTELLWVDGILDSVRCWRGVEGGAPFTSWKDLKSIARAHDLKFYSSGLRTQGPEAGARLQVRRLFAIMQKANLNVPRCVMMVHDLDDLESPGPWLDECARAPDGLTVVCAVPIPEMEAWIIATFDPVDDRAQEALVQVTRSLGKDPRLVAHTLNPGRVHTQDGAPMPRSTKLVAAALMPDVAGRIERLCAQSVSQLEARGQHVGLRAFLRALREHFLPSLGR